VKWLLVIPHLSCCSSSAIGAWFVAIFAFFAILFTGRYPRGCVRLPPRRPALVVPVSAYYMLMVDPYPPFSLEDDPNYPVRLEVDHPEHIANWRALVHWLLVIPYAIVATVLVYFTFILAFFSFFTILFTKKDPARHVRSDGSCGLRWHAARQRLHLLHDGALPDLDLGLTP
jgi:hypothetical protein